MSDLAKRAVACPGWRWMAGMLTTHGRIVGGLGLSHLSGLSGAPLVTTDQDETGAWVECTDTVDDWPAMLPDLDDPATLGCLLTLVTEAHDEEMLPCMDSKGDWGVRRAIPGYAPVIPEIHRTKAEALVAALEAAPDGT